MLNNYSESVSDDPSPNQESNKNFQCSGLEMAQRLKVLTPLAKSGPGPSTHMEAQSFLNSNCRGIRCALLTYLGSRTCEMHKYPSRHTRS